MSKNNIFIIFVAFIVGFMTRILIKTICGDVVEGSSEVAGKKIGDKCQYTPKICYVSKARDYSKQNLQCSDDKECQVENKTFRNGPPKCIHPRNTQYCKDGNPCPKGEVCPPV